MLLSLHRVTLSDTRTLLGTLLAFDAHMNVVLGDTEEYRLVKEAKKTKEVREKGAPGEEPTWVEEKRLLGLVLLRGETVISMTAEDPPQPPVKLDSTLSLLLVVLTLVFLLSFLQPRVAPGTLATPLPIPMMPGMPMGHMIKNVILSGVFYKPPHNLLQVVCPPALECHQ